MMLEIVLFMFVRSLREANLKCLPPASKLLFLGCLPSTMYIMRDGCLFIFEIWIIRMSMLHHCTNSFQSFTVKNTTYNFSNIAIDGAQEQNKKAC